MPIMTLEITNDTLVMTENGPERLEDLLHRPVKPALWAIKWRYRQHANGISFHKSHKLAKRFADAQIDSKPAGPARLVNVSDQLYKSVQENGYYWTNLTRFEDAEQYEEPQCNH